MRLGTWPTKSLALVDDDDDGDPVPVELSSKVPDFAAEAPTAAAAAAAVLGLRCCGFSVAGDLGDLVAVTADEREAMEGKASFSGSIPGVLLVEP